MFKFGVMAVMVLAVIRDVKAANCVDDAGCGTHGTCPDASAPCVCTDGYSGDACDTAPVCTANGNECGSHGSCDTSGTTYSCDCTDGYTGATCTTAPCTSGGGECGSHGTCNTAGTTVKCDCTPGYTGTLCTQQSGGSRVTFLAQVLLIPIVLSRYMHAYKAQYACLYPLTTAPCVGTIADLKTAAATSATCTSCTFDDTCVCQRAFDAATKGTDAEKCNAYKAALSCLRTARSTGCDSTMTKSAIATAAETARAAPLTGDCPGGSAEDHVTFATTSLIVSVLVNMSLQRPSMLAL